MVGGQIGFMTVLKSGGPDHIMDIIPVDYAINLIVAVAYETASKK